MGSNVYRKFLKLYSSLISMLMISMLLPSVAAGQSWSHEQNPISGLLQGVEINQDVTKSAVLNKVISVKMRSATVLEALEEVAGQADLELIYNAVDLESVNHRLTLNVEEMTINQALWTILEDTGFQYAVSSHGQLVIMRNPEYERMQRPLENHLQVTVTGQVVDAQTGEALPGVNVIIDGSEEETGSIIGTQTNLEGSYSINVPEGLSSLVFTYIGYQRLEVDINGRSEIDIQLHQDIQMLDDLIVVGYGVQRRSDITGSVASISAERMEMVPNQNIAQAIQGAIPGVMVQTTSAGAAPSESIMIRGRNSISASNSPLIVIDGVPYGGNLSDVNPTDIQSIEVLKDASAAAIYGSRGSNGVILVTTKEGLDGSPRITYNGHVSIQQFTNLPDIMEGEQFYNFKIERVPGSMTQSEQAVYDSGEWVNWRDLALRRGASHEHNLSISGGSTNTSYYISGSFLDVQGLAKNDDYSRGSVRLNIDTDIGDWLSVGTRTQLSSADESGASPSMYDVFWTNPLAVPYDSDGRLTVRPIADDPQRANPLQSTLYDDTHESRQVITNNFANIDLERFISGLNFRFNYGLTYRYTEASQYRGLDTFSGSQAGGRGSLSKDRLNNSVIESVFSYRTEINDHNIFATAVLSYENNDLKSDSLSLQGFPNDLLSWYAAGQADLIEPSFVNNNTVLQSQMLRLSYGYDNRYNVTLTARRDGFSGFGRDSKWGVFPSVAISWSLHNESFFPWQELLNDFRLRASYGVNGNQAVGAYQSMTTLREENHLSGSDSLPGFLPSTLGQENLGWESSQTINAGIDFGILGDRISGDVNIYRTNTQDLLLQRTISSVHGITSILENIGETANRGIEFSLLTRNIDTNDFQWSTRGNISFVSNEIVDLYGDGRDDVANSWFIGQPISVNYDYVFNGVWQLDEAEAAAAWGTQPGFVKIKDVTGDGQIGPDDRQIIGQTDPKALWGITNTIAYRNFNLNVFVHAVHGVTKENTLMDDNIVTSGVRRNTTVKNWWTPDNPTNDWFMNHISAHQMAGVSADIYENASFVRLKDVTLSYNLPFDLIQRMGLNSLRLHATGRNLYTLTNWNGLDPELSDQVSIPLQREFVFGVQIEL